MKSYAPGSRSAFTLIEVIVTFLLASVVAAVLLTYVSKSLHGFDRPREAMGPAFSVHRVMENIVSSHREGTELLELSAAIGNESSDQQNAFGEYHVTQNHFVEFTNNPPQEVVAVTNSNLLKVTIQNELGETLSRLFREP